MLLAVRDEPAARQQQFRREPSRGIRLGEGAPTGLLRLGLHQRASRIARLEQRASEHALRLEGEWMPRGLRREAREGGARGEGALRELAGADVRVGQFQVEAGDQQGVAARLRRVGARLL